MVLSPEQEKFARTFHPYALSKTIAVQSAQTRFVYYTRADTAMRILSTREVWMRKSSCLNDFMEVEHGLSCLLAAYKTDQGDKLKSVLEKAFPGIVKEVEDHFNGWIPHFRTDTYLTCVSEHDPSEDTFGRLSMWRAYGYGTEIALVLNNSPFFGTSGALKAYANPVAYMDLNGVAEQLGTIANAIESDQQRLKGLGRDYMVGAIFQMFKFAALCTKHPGFAEEREWRIVYSPTQEESPYLVKDVQSINGVPQPIYKILLKDVPAAGLIGFEIPSLVERIIIGPTEFPFPMWQAFVGMLQAAGVSDAATRVFISDIPLRRM